MDELIERVLNSKTWAVVGATSNETKFGYKIYKRLKSEGYEVYPINPTYDQIDGERCFHKIEELPEIVECVNMVVSSKFGKPMLVDIKEKGIKTIWFQPGTWDLDLIDYAKSLEFDVIYDHCVLVELTRR